MIPVVLFFVLVLLLFGASTAVHALLWVALIALVLWVAGFAVHPHGGKRWFYW